MVAEYLLRHAQLGFSDISSPAWIHVDSDGSYLAATLVQQTTQGRVVCAMVGQELTSLERKEARLEQLLVAAAWAIKRL